MLRDTIDDRLFKIHNCMDINRIARPLPLFEPPIDPALLVKAKANGISINSVLDDLRGPLPRSRFTVLLQTTVNMAQELKAMGAFLLSRAERDDSENYNKQNAANEINLRNMAMGLRTQQLDEADRALSAISQSKAGTASRLRSLLRTLNQDTGNVPDGTKGFNPIKTDGLEPPPSKDGEEGGWAWLREEAGELDKLTGTKLWSKIVGGLELGAAILNLPPKIDANASPWGFAALFSWHPSQLSKAATTFVRVMRITEDLLRTSATVDGRWGGLKRQMLGRIQQANALGSELEGAFKQENVHMLRKQMALSEMERKQMQIDMATDVRTFIEEKRTNQELYEWIRDTVQPLYHETYKLTFEMATKAERALQLERPREKIAFIGAGLWDPARNGFMAGELLLHDLCRLELAY